MITFRVDGIPKAQPRAKARRMGNRAGVYDPGTAEGWKALVAAAAMPHRPAVPLEGPLFVEIDFYMPRPKSLMRAKDPEGPIRCWKKPDVDNLIKAVFDSLKNLGVFRDDGQISESIGRKFYPAKTGRPGAKISIKAIDNQETLYGNTTQR